MGACWGEKQQQGGDQAYLLCVAVSYPTRARHRERHGREERCGDEEGTGGKVTVFASSQKICRLIQQLGALCPHALHLTLPLLPSRPYFSLVHSLPLHHRFLFFVALFKLLSGEGGGNSVILAPRKLVFNNFRDFLCRKSPLYNHDYPPFHRRALWLCTEWRSLYSSFPQRDPLTDICVRHWGLKVAHGGPWVELLHTTHTRV